MKDRTLVVGATGHVGSQVVKILASQGRSVRALVRKPGVTIHGAPQEVEYALGDMNDAGSLESALRGVQTVVSTATALIPTNHKDSIASLNLGGYDTLITACERAGVEQFVQASVPSHPVETSIPELAGKRVIEQRLARSPIPTAVIRNPAFTDVWLVMVGAKQAIGSDPHATTRRPYGFMQLWQSLTGDLVAKRGLMLAPGGAEHGSMFITTRDVAYMLAGCVGHAQANNVVWEAGGPAWVTWREVAALFSTQTGKPVRTLPLPASMAAFSQKALTPFSEAAANVLGLVRFVATWQPRWDSAPLVEKLNLPRQTTVAEYIERNFKADSAPAFARETSV